MLMAVATSRRAGWRKDCSWALGQAECREAWDYNIVLAWCGGSVQHPGTVLGSVGGVLAEGSHLTPEGGAQSA